METFMNYRILCLLCVIALLIAGVGGCDQSSTPAADNTPPSQAAAPTSAPAMQIDQNKRYAATVDTTAGKITIELFATESPVTANNFVVLARKGFYNGTIFHRVIPEFMIQGGDPTGTGMGGPGYQFKNENMATTRTFSSGIVAMANAGLDTNGSQFFIMDTLPKPYPLPASNYTIFGNVTDGQDVVHKIATAPRGDNDRPNDPVKINSVTITEN
jgi:cyclophilin family peptidyl-prolyl cis-trans isomerase